MNQLWTSADNCEYTKDKNPPETSSPGNGSLKNSKNKHKLGGKLKSKTKSKTISNETKKKISKTLKDPETKNELKIVEGENLRKSLEIVPDRNEPKIENVVPTIPDEPLPTPPPPPPQEKISEATPSQPEDRFSVETKESTPSTDDINQPTDYTVSVDIHRPNSTISVEKNNNSLKIDRNVTETSEVLSNVIDSHELESIDEVDRAGCQPSTKIELVVEPEGERSPEANRPTTADVGVQIKRKQFIQQSTRNRSTDNKSDADDEVSSTFDESDADPVYEQVELRKVSYFFFFSHFPNL